MIKNILTLLFIALLTVGCGEKPQITPDKLSNAYTGKPYQQTIKISGGKIIDKDQPLKTNIPEDLGITVQPANDLDGYNIIEIKGTPKYKGTFTIHFWGGFYGGGDAEINKTYTFKVE